MKLSMMLKIAPWAVSAALLCGCSVLGGSKEPVTLYSPDARIAPDPAWPQVDWQLAIVKPTAPRVFDNPRISVRPQPDKLEVYQGASWVQPPPDMLEGTLLHAFEDSNKIAAVARLGTGIRADYKLAIDMRRFESDYAGQALPTATIEFNAKLIHSTDQRIVASHTFLVTEQATATDTDAVAAAFDVALKRTASEVVGWTLRAGQHDAAAHPAPTPATSTR